MLVLDKMTLSRGTFRLHANTAFAPGITAIIGPSGAGKSTILDAVAGFLAPESGRVLWGDTEITGLPPGERPVSVVFQDQNLFPHLTALQNVGLGLSPGLKLSRDEAASVERVLARVGLEGLGNRKPAALSGGQQSRVALARVLIRERPVVLLDEPFAALGPSLRAEMLDLVSDTLGDKTVLMVTHDPEDARRIAMQTCVVADGAVTAPAETRDLLDNPPPALRAYLGA